MSCNSENNKPKIEIVKETSKIKIKSSENIVVEKSPPIIYDTLVFNENMKGELLSEKCNSPQIKLEIYRKFITPKRFNIVKTLTDKHTKTKIKYLGIINDLNKEAAHHVITNFQIYGIGQMLSRRGKAKLHSLIRKIIKL